MKGKVVSLYHSNSRYGGSYGEILGDDGDYYIWSSGNVFRNGSTIDEVGAVVEFNVVAFSYATDINRLDKNLIRG